VSESGSLFIISAPSGAGKTSLVTALMKEISGVSASVSYTTRPPRVGEQDGQHYHFVDHNEFKEMLNKHIFLEHAEVFGHFYGTSRQHVAEKRAQGLDVILEIDWQGARQIRAHFVDAISIFILPPSREVLLERLHKRHQDNEKVIQIRMKEASEEILRWAEYDYLIYNDKFDEALRDLKAIVRSTRLTLRSQRESRGALIQKLLS